MAPMPSSPRPLVEDRPVDESSVDTTTGRSLSFAPPQASIPPPLPTGSNHQGRRARIAVGPGRPAIVSATLPSGGLLGAMPEFPIQVSKVQPPPLRDQTLARDRLLEWLAVKIHDRVVLLTAEAGYGKTTLLADFARRSRVRCLWFRLDRGDRDWVGFIAHLVAAVRIHSADFGPATDSLLRETATAAPPLDTVLDAFLRELATLPPDSSALIFDDFHLVDDAPEIRHIAKELLARAPERLSFVFASRRTPPIRLARLRALGEVAELLTDDLRFDTTETERLFTETYEMRLEPSLIAELSRRTEGWAASLQLVRTAIHDRNPGQVRAFISSLSGAEGHLYDYLAEEVVGDLPPSLQEFLMRTSVLETIDLDLGPVAADIPVATTRDLIVEGERLGLFGRRGANTADQVRAHPLVREFLQARLARSIGAGSVVQIHRRVAEAAEALNWRVATHHYLASGDESSARRVLSSSIETILATGAYAAADELATTMREGVPGVVGLILRSRVAQQRADAIVALQLAEEAHLIDPTSRPGQLNLVTARSLAGDLDGAMRVGQLLERGPNDLLARIARCFQLTIGTSLEGSLPEAIGEVEALAETHRERSDLHYLGVAQCNLAYLKKALGDVDGARLSAEAAVRLLAETSAGVELTSARLALAWTLAFQGDLESSRREVLAAARQAPPGQAIEIAYESAEIEGLFGDPARAWPLLRSVSPQVSEDTDWGEQALLSRALLEIRDGDRHLAAADLGRLTPGKFRTAPTFDLRRRLAEAAVALLLGRHDAATIAEAAVNLATVQGALTWRLYGEVLWALASAGDPSSVVERVGAEVPAVLSIAAEPLLARLEKFDPSASSRIAEEARNRSVRWLDSARRELSIGTEDHRLALAQLLERIGEPDDISRLRDAARTLKDRRAVGLGRSLARRLAPRVMIEDLGRVRLTIGNRLVDGSEVRRKVLALLCLLLTMPRHAGTREEVLEQLWPELDPPSALNSLNQTTYFLRRVFEPAYREDTSPTYLHQDSETIWLDQELIHSRSASCREIIRSVEGSPTPDQAASLADEYRAKFALDFAYEDWASSYRDQLHAAYLRVIEHAVRLDIETGHFTRGTLLAERAAEVEPDSDDIQVALIRLYRLSGAHAAAAEQYGHYASNLRQIGVEPPAFAEV